MTQGNLPRESSLAPYWVGLAILVLFVSGFVYWQIPGPKASASPKPNSTPQSVASYDGESERTEPEGDSEPTADSVEAPTDAIPDPELPYPDESSITEQLRSWAQSEPELTLGLAVEGNERFPNGDDAAERDYFLTRALVNLKRFDEAQQHAKMMVEKYPGSHFAGEVERHLLVNPLGLPTREEQERLNQEKLQAGEQENQPLP